MQSKLCHPPTIQPSFIRKASTYLRLPPSPGRAPTAPPVALKLRYAQTIKGPA